VAKRKYLVDGKSYDVEVLSRTGADAAVRVNGKSYRVEYIPDDPPQAVKHAGATSGAARPGAIAASAIGEIRAPMAGSIVQIHVRPGDTCQAGTPLVVLDAMKMENTLAAPRACRIAQVAVSVGESVLQGALLLQIN
jgi:biotin carboxyl carrier protein